MGEKRKRVKKSRKRKEEGEKEDTGRKERIEEEIDSIPEIPGVKYPVGNTPLEIHRVFPTGYLTPGIS
jgi:hypothetical protein